MTARTSPLSQPLSGTTTSAEVLGVAKRATLLVATSGPYNPDVTGDVDRLPRDNPALRGLRSGIYLALTATPQLVLDRVAQSSLGGPPETPEQAAKHRRAMMLGNAALIAAGVLAQRAINHSGRSGPIAQVGRAVAGQLAIGAAAATIAAGSNSALGPLLKRSDGQSAATLAISALTLRTQSRLLSKVASVVLLPTRPSRYDYVA